MASEVAKEYEKVIGLLNHLSGFTLIIGALVAVKAMTMSADGSELHLVAWAGVLLLLLLSVILTIARVIVRLNAKDSKMLEELIERTNDNE